MEPELRQRGRRKHAVGRTMMKRLFYILLAVEAVLAVCAWRHAISGNAAVLLLALNTVLLIFSAKRWLSTPSCCR